MPEFTGERLVPGEVDADLWNEHLSRYLFARRLARHKRVLDIACGHGYGAAELARAGLRVVGCDLEPAVVAQAKSDYSAPNLQFCAARAEELPFADGSFDLITAFEVIEHLEHWEKLLESAARLLAPGGQFVVSTPNRLYYEESRRLAGPNPFHVREFSIEEFRAALQEIFPAVRLYTQNHVGAICFHPLHCSAPAAEISMEASAGGAATSHFLLAVCARSPQVGGPAFVFVPSTSNVLRDRELHIQKLEAELQVKDGWLLDLQARHASLSELHAEQTAEMEKMGVWAKQLEKELQDAQRHIYTLDEHIVKLGREIEALQESSRDLHRDNARLNREVETRGNELARAVNLLHGAEAELEERTRWALSLQNQIDELERVLRAAGTSGWLKLGRKLGLGPALPHS